MRSRMSRLLLLAVAASSLPSIGSPASDAVVTPPCQALIFAERGGKPVGSMSRSILPRTTVSRPGQYCLDQDVHQGALFDPLRRREALMPLEAVIRIEADDVWLDLKGHGVSNSSRPGMAMIWFSKFAVGKREGTRLKRARIENGRLESPGATGIGIDLTASRPYGLRTLQVAPIKDGMTADVFEETRHVIESMTIAAGKRAIQLDGRNNTIRNNRLVVDSATAIVAHGPGIVIEDNIIEIRNDFRGFSAFDRKQESMTPFPIRLIQADGAVIRNNRIRLVDRTSGAGLPAAIELVESRDVTIEGNHFGGMDAPVRADLVSSYSATENESEPCPGGARYLPPSGANEGAQAAPACR